MNRITEIPANNFSLLSTKTRISRRDSNKVKTNSEELKTNTTKQF